MPRLLGSLLVALSLSPAAIAQTPSPLAAYDESVLRQAGVGTDAASLLKHLRDYTHGNGDPRRINALIEQLGHDDFEKRQRAMRDLITLGRPALEALRKASKGSTDIEIRRGAAHCVAEIENALDANVVLSAVRRLVHLRAGGAAESLLALLPDVDWQTQDDIFHGLPQVALRDGKLDPALLAALDDQSPTRRAAAALAVALAGGDADRTKVRKLLTDADANVRLRTAQGLLAAHDAASLPVLIALLDEPRVEISWSAEELLHWAAGETAPAQTVGKATAAERKKAVAAWTAWQQQNADKLDWPQLDKTPRRPGLFLVSEGNRVWLCGCDGKQRWSLPGGFGAHDFVLLPNNELVVAPLNGDGYLIKCDLSGKEIWKHVDRNTDDYVVCQRLPDGNFFVATQEDIGVVSATGQLVAVRNIDDFSSGDAWMLRNGHIICRHDEGVAEIAAFNGPILRDAPVENARFSPMHKFAVFPDGRLVIADYRRNRLMEIDAGGKALRTLPIRGAWSVEALRNGNYVVSTVRDLRVIEVDPEGRTVWEVVTKQRVNRVRAVLDRVGIGFDRPRPADYNLDSVANRLRGLKDPDEAVRRRAAEFVGYLKPTDDASITVLVAALDDTSQPVRVQVAGALAEIGPPALPRLKEALKKGTDNSRLAALDALYRMGPDAKGALAELTDLLRDEKNASALRGQAAATIGRTGPEGTPALPVLLAALKGEDDAVRRQAAPALVAVAPKNADVMVGLVTAMKDDKHPQGRLAALEAIRSQGAAAKAAIPDLLTLLNAPESPVLVRQLAMQALAGMGPEAKDAVPALLALLKDKDQPGSVRCSAALHVGRFGEHSKAVLPALSDLLRDPKLPDDVAASVVTGLATMGKDGVPALAEVVKEGNAATRRAAINQLVELGEVAKPAIPALQEAAKDKDPNISRLAGRAIRIIEMGDGRKGPTK